MAAKLTTRVSRFEVITGQNTVAVRIELPIDDGREVVHDEATVPLALDRSVQWHIDQAWDSRIGQRLADLRALREAELAEIRKSGKPEDSRNGLTYEPKSIPSPTPPESEEASDVEK